MTRCGKTLLTVNLSHVMCVCFFGFQMFDLYHTTCVSCWNGSFWFFFPHCLVLRWDIGIPDIKPKEWFRRENLSSTHNVTFIDGHVGLKNAKCRFCSCWFGRFYLKLNMFAECLTGDKKTGISFHFLSWLWHRCLIHPELSHPKSDLI